MKYSIFFILFFCAVASLNAQHNHSHNDTLHHLHWGKMNFNFSPFDSPTRSVGSQLPADVFATSLLSEKPSIEKPGGSKATSILFQLDFIDPDNVTYEKLTLRTNASSDFEALDKAKLALNLSKLRNGHRVEMRNLKVDSSSFLGYFSIQCLAVENGFSPQSGLFRSISCTLQFGNSVVQAAPENLADSINWYKPISLPLGIIDSISTLPLFVQYQGKRQSVVLEKWSFDAAAQETVVPLANNGKPVPPLQRLASMKKEAGTLRMVLKGDQTDRFFVIINIGTDGYTLQNTNGLSVANNLLPQSLKLRSHQKQVLTLGDFAWPNEEGKMVFPIRRDSLQTALSQVLKTNGLKPITKITCAIIESKGSVLMPLYQQTTMMDENGKLKNIEKVMNNLNRQGPDTTLLFTLFFENNAPIRFGAVLKNP